MKALFRSPGFSQELLGWIFRGTLCALSSFYWAYAVGFQHPVEILGMFTGIVAWAIIFAWLTIRIFPGRELGLRTVRALKRAAWIKFGLMILGWLTFFGIGALRLQGGVQLASLGLADVWLGLAALGLVNVVGGFRGVDQIASLDSFGWTALTTFVDGLLFAIIIGLIACLVLGWWRFKNDSVEK